MVDALQTEHRRLTRRVFARWLAAGTSATALVGCERGETTAPQAPSVQLSYLTAQEMFGTVERGKPLPYTLEPEALAAAGLTPKTWALQILADPDDPAVMDRELSKAAGTAFTYADLRRLARTHTVRFLKTLTCANGAKPLGTGLWEGVPLREVVRRTGVRKNFRRMSYVGFHNHDPKQVFRSSLPADRLYEDPLQTPPVILAYRLNGEPLSGKRGGPVRLIVPESYGFKNVKWLDRIFLSNRSTSSDTYAKYGNTTESWMKTLARFATRPERVSHGAAVPLSGIAQVGTAGLTRVQVLVLEGEAKAEDHHFRDHRGWVDAQILPPPRDWGGGLPRRDEPGARAGRPAAFGFTDDGRPESWPMRFTSAHWAALLLAPRRRGRYTAFCRTLDWNGTPQPWPRPLQNSGRNRLHRISFEVR